MKKNITSWISCICIIISLTNCSVNQKDDSSSFEREKELIQLCELKKIDLKNTLLIMVPPSFCAACVKSAQEEVDKTDQALTYLHSSVNECYAKAGQRVSCVPYEQKEAADLGLIYAYPIKFELRDGEVVSYTPIL